VSKLALLIGLDRAVQILPGPLLNGSQPVAVMRLPYPVTMPGVASVDIQTPMPKRDRRFRLKGELRDYWVYEEEW